MSNVEFVQIKDLKPGMKNINAVFIVLEVGPPTLTKEAREVRSLRVADATAAVNLSVWDEAGALLLPGDIVRLSRGYASLWRSQLTLYSGKSGDIQKIDEFCMLFNEQINMSEQQPTPPPPPLSPAPGPRGPQPPPSAAPLQTHKDRFPTERGAGGGVGGGGGAGGGAGGGGGAAGAEMGAKHAHKTYVRGRGAHRGGNARR